MITLDKARESGVDRVEGTVIGGMMIVRGNGRGRRRDRRRVMVGTNGERRGAIESASRSAGADTRTSVRD